MARDELEVESALSKQCEETALSAVDVLRIGSLPFEDSDPQEAPIWRRHPKNEVRPTSFAHYYRKYTMGLLKILSAMDVEQIEEFVVDLLVARQNNRQIFFIGNGGSAATASHFVTDLTKDRFDDERFLFRTICLCDNSALVSATANDFGYEEVFVKQLKNLLQPGDLLIAISSSGNSPNILRALEYANKRGAVTYGILGFGGGKAAQIAKKLLYIPTKPGQYGFMEDVSMVLGHIVCTFIETLDRRTVPEPRGGI